MKVSFLPSSSSSSLAIVIALVLSSHHGALGRRLGEPYDALDQVSKLGVLDLPIDYGTSEANDNLSDANLEVDPAAVELDIPEDLLNPEKEEEAEEEFFEEASDEDDGYYTPGKSRPFGPNDDFPVARGNFPERDEEAAEEEFFEGAPNRYYIPQEADKDMPFGPNDYFPDAEIMDGEFPANAGGFPGVDERSFPGAGGYSPSQEISEIDAEKTEGKFHDNTGGFQGDGFPGAGGVWEDAEIAQAEDIAIDAELQEHVGGHNVYDYDYNERYIDRAADVLSGDGLMGPGYWEEEKEEGVSVPGLDAADQDEWDIPGDWMGPPADYAPMDDERAKGINPLDWLPNGNVNADEDRSYMIP